MICCLIKLKICITWLNIYIGIYFNLIYFIDEKEKYDPFGFRDFILGGLNNAGTDLEAIWKFLDQAGSKVDYRRYGEVLFDILIAGGLLGKHFLFQVSFGHYNFVFF